VGRRIFLFAELRRLIMMHSDRPAGRESMDVDLIPVQVIQLPDPKPDEERPIKAADVPVSSSSVVIWRRSIANHAM